MRKATGGYCTYSSIVELQPRFLSFAVEDLPLGRIAVLVPEFAVKDLPLVRTLMMLMMMMMMMMIEIILKFSNEQKCVQNPARTE